MRCGNFWAFFGRTVYFKQDKRLFNRLSSSRDVNADECTERKKKERKTDWCTTEWKSLPKILCQTLSIEICATLFDVRKYVRRLTCEMPFRYVSVFGVYSEDQRMLLRLKVLRVGELSILQIDKLQNNIKHFEIHDVIGGSFGRRSRINTDWWTVAKSVLYPTSN